MFTALAITAVVFMTGACTKPNPGVTVTSGTSSSHSLAICWSEETSIDASRCSESQVAGALSDPNTPIITVISDQTLSISVDPKVAEFGWYPAINGQRLSAKATTSTYYRFTFPQTEIPPSGFNLQIVSQSQTGGTRGIWIFKLLGHQE